LINGDDPDYIRLQEIEKRHRAIQRQNEAPYFRMLMFWDDTVLQAVLVEPMLWIAMAIYVAVRVGAYTSLPAYVSEIGSIDTTAVSAFLTFF
jgi:hypothetical protein